MLVEHDAMTPPRAAAGLIDPLPGASVVQVAGSGHALKTEAPDALRDALDEWLRGAALERAAAA